MTTKSKEEKKWSEAKEEAEKDINEIRNQFAKK